MASLTQPPPRVALTKPRDGVGGRRWMDIQTQRKGFRSLFQGFGILVEVTFGTGQSFAAGGDAMRFAGCDQSPGFYS